VCVCECARGLQIYGLLPGILALSCKLRSHGYRVQELALLLALSAPLPEEQASALTNFHAACPDLHHRPQVGKLVYCTRTVPEMEKVGWQGRGEGPACVACVHLWHA